MYKHLMVFALALSFLNGTAADINDKSATAFEMAFKNGRLANEGFQRCQRYLSGWLQHADSVTGLIPRNLTKDSTIWNAQDAAADNYPFMVLTAALLDRPRFNGQMLEMLATEIKLTSRLGSLPDTYSFSKRDFLSDVPDTARIIFGASEYIKDGLLPLTEWLGPSPWSERLLNILNDLWYLAPVKTRFGNIVSNSQEINGEMLQTLARIYWMTADEQYLDWATRLGNYYLLGEHHPTKHGTKLRLRDHGCEIVSGLCEFYATVCLARPEQKAVYQKPIETMLDRILEIGRNEHGLFYNIINPQTGQPINPGVADTWGYTFNGFYTVYLIDKIEKYRQATLQALSGLKQHYHHFDWEHGSADGYADAIESALNLYNREPVAEAAQWIDSEIRIMWEKQKSDGIIEGWHGDGNFARTTLMYCLWKTQGVSVNPWEKELIFGAVQQAGKIFIGLKSQQKWSGKLMFDTPRHQIHLKLPFDWPRINQFPEWFTVSPEQEYWVMNVTNDSKEKISGQKLLTGLDLRLDAGTELCFIIQPIPGGN